VFAEGDGIARRKKKKIGIAFLFPPLPQHPNKNKKQIQKSNKNVVFFFW
jgi:hypothetical protein